MNLKCTDDLSASFDTCADANLAIFREMSGLCLTTNLPETKIWFYRRGKIYDDLSYWNFGRHSKKIVILSFFWFLLRESCDFGHFWFMTVHFMRLHVLHVAYKFQVILVKFFCWGTMEKCWKTQFWENEFKTSSYLKLWNLKLSSIGEIK